MGAPRSAKVSAATAASTPGSPDRQRKGVPKRCSMACTTCRQVKLRCDAAARHPARCTRCEKRHKPCYFDSDFKRKPVRGALEKLLEENEQLHRMVDSLHTEPSAEPASAAASSRQSSFRSASPVAAPQQPCDDEPSYSLHGVQLSSQAVRDLFQFFLEVHFPFLPILDLNKPPSSVHADSPLLFWAVIVTAARHHPIHRDLFGLLRVPFRKLLSEVFLDPSRSIYTIQALLILCAWPFPLRFRKDDPSWNYCGLAVSMAMQLRLHDVQGTWWYSETGVRETSGRPEERYKTWLGCFLVSTTIATDMCLPPPMSAVASLEPSVRLRVQDSLPEDFVLRLELQSCACRMYLLMREGGHYALQMSQIDLFDQELAGIERKLARLHDRPLFPFVQLDLLAARYSLRAPMLMRSRRKPGDVDGRETALSHGSDAGVLIEALWRSTLYLAADMIATITGCVHSQTRLKENGAGSSNRNDRLTIAPADTDRCFPKHHYVLWATATFLLILFLASHRDTISAQERSLVRSRVRQAIDYLVAVSSEPFDEHDRMSKLIVLVFRFVEDDATASDFRDAPVPPSANVMDTGFEVAWMIRRRFCVKYLDAQQTQGGNMSLLPAAVPLPAPPPALRSALPSAQPLPPPPQSLPTSSQLSASLLEAAAVLSAEAASIAPARAAATESMPPPAAASLPPLGPSTTTAETRDGIDGAYPVTETLGVSDGLTVPSWEDEMVSEWSTWFNDTDDFMTLFRMPPLNQM